MLTSTLGEGWMPVGLFDNWLLGILARYVRASRWIFSRKNRQHSCLVFPFFPDT